MAKIYKHGVYSEQESSIMDANTPLLANCPAYIGTLPIQRIANSADYINKPILITSYKDVKELGIYSDDWATYSLCEVINAHLLNGVNVVAPFILVNMLDPTKHVKESATTSKIILSKEGATLSGYIKDSKCNIDELTVTANEVQLENGDFTIAYEGDSVKLIITKKEVVDSGKYEVTVSYTPIELKEGSIKAADFEKALNSLDYSELITGFIPNIISAPGYTHIPEIHDVLMLKVNAMLSEKWRVVACVDIPCDKSVDTFEKAIQWKKDNAYNNKHEKVCYPKVIYENKKYHLSTIASFTMQATDVANGDTPHVSPSNKTIYADGTILDDGTQILISESQANKMNEKGITTVNIIRRRLRLWGSHMANYDFEKLDTISYEDRSDSNIRMMLYLLNYLQYNFIDNIDTSFSRKDVDSIITSVQQFLNSLVNENKLLFATISFNDSDNATENMIDGDFVFNVTNTLVPNAKSITFKVNYSTQGLTLLTGGGE